MIAGLNVSLASPAVAVALVAALALDMCRVEGRLRVVFDTQLNRLGPLLPGDVAREPQPQVDARGHPRRGDHTAVIRMHDALITDRGHPERLQQRERGPVRGGPLALEETGCR